MAGEEPTLTTAWGSPVKHLQIPSDLFHRLKQYNLHHRDSQLQILTKNKADGSVLMEGKVRIYWGVSSQIHFQEQDERKTNKRITHCGLDTLKLHQDSTIEEIPLSTLHRTDDVEDLSALSPTREEPRSPGKEIELLRSHTFANADILRKARPRRRVQRRMSVINGHSYKLETSVFVPLLDSLTSVHVTSDDTSPQVIALLLNKFKVCNVAKEFCLCAVKKTGELRLLGEDDRPLIERVMMGPLDTEHRLYIRNRRDVKVISEEVATFMALPIPMLLKHLEKLKSDEEKEKSEIYKRFDRWREVLQREFATRKRCSYADVVKMTNHMRSD